MAVDKGQFTRLLKEKGLKATNQRLKALEAIASSPKEHLTAEEIYEFVKASGPEIGLATVYRKIQLLNELRLVDRINFDDGFVHYEMGSAQECGHKTPPSLFDLHKIRQGDFLSG